jgi:hypothetical protein
MWKIEDAQAGRIPTGKSRQGESEGTMFLEMDGRKVYQLQKYLEEQVEKGGDFFGVRMVVLLHEELRQAVILAQERKGTGYSKPTQ